MSALERYVCSSYLFECVSDVDAKVCSAELCEGGRVSVILPGKVHGLASSESARSDRRSDLVQCVNGPLECGFGGDVRKRLPVPRQQERGEQWQS